MNTNYRCLKRTLGPARTKEGLRLAELKRDLAVICLRRAGIRRHVAPRERAVPAEMVGTLSVARNGNARKMADE